ncbi:CHAT domain-containing protein [Micromonospora sp. DT53]|uniref:CHAT domain-containing protein n=1 Tax=Micromonospora sp. DT53 TaxID=3393444 RepID=UPI003CF443D5
MSRRHARTVSLHAAGHVRASGTEPVRTVLDRAVVSYTPTARALRHARSRTASGRLVDRALIVAMPTTPGARELPFAAQEAQLVAGSFAEHTILSDGTASGRAVHEVLAACDVADFACHGVVDTLRPSQSRLLLADHLSDPFTVARVLHPHQER